LGSKPAQANSSQDLISKRTRAKWTGGVAEAFELLLCKLEALSSTPSPTKRKKRKEKETTGLVALPL
jgi:hypothetical protein